MSEQPPFDPNNPPPPPPPAYPQAQYPPAPGYPEQPGGPQQPYGYAQPPKSSGKAIVALILALVSFVLCGIFTSIPAFFVGRSAVKEIDRSQGAITGRGMATAAWIIALINIVITVLVIGLFAILFANGTCVGESSDNEFSFSCE